MSTPDLTRDVLVTVDRDGDVVRLAVGVIVLGMTREQAKALAAALVRVAR